MSVRGRQAFRIVSSRSRWNYIEENGEVVGHAAGKDEDMPDCVKVAESVEGKEDDAQRVGQSSCDQPRQPMPAEGVE